MVIQIQPRIPACMCVCVCVCVSVHVSQAPCTCFPRLSSRHFSASLNKHSLSVSCVHLQGSRRTCFAASHHAHTTDPTIHSESNTRTGALGLGLPLYAGRLLDIGAGDGGVTAEIAPLFSHGPVSLLLCSPLVARAKARCAVALQRSTLAHALCRVVTFVCCVASCLCRWAVQWT